MLCPKKDFGISKFSSLCPLLPSGILPHANALDQKGTFIELKLLTSSLNLPALYRKTPETHFLKEKVLNEEGGGGLLDNIMLHVCDKS